MNLICRLSLAYVIVLFPPSYGRKVSYFVRVPVRFWPLESRIRSKLRHHRSMDEMCLSHTIVCPDETSLMPPVIMPLGHRALVTASQQETTLGMEWNRISGFKSLHKATERYTFSNVLATPFGFFVGGHGFNQFGQPSFGEFRSAQIHKADKGFFGLSAISMKYFGHWLLDGLPNTLLRQPGEELYFPVNPSWGHAETYLDLLEIDRLEHDYVLFDTMYSVLISGKTGTAEPEPNPYKMPCDQKSQVGTNVSISAGVIPERTAFSPTRPSLARLLKMWDLSRCPSRHLLRTFLQPALERM